jgi:hypothetical protein
MGEKLKKWAKEGGVEDSISGIAGTVGSVAQISSNLKDSKRLNERGVSLGKVDTMGNTMSAMGAGASLGSVGGPLGTAIGAGVGAIAGLSASLLTKGPSMDEKLAKENQFQLGLATKSIQNEDMFAKGMYTAENGMDVKGAPKQIEVERGELVLRKKGRAFYVDSSFDAAYRKPHSEGGEKYNAKPGDIIIPKDKVAKTKRLMKSRNWSGVESIRQGLPKDEGQLKFAKGVAEIKEMSDRFNTSTDPNNPGDIMEANKKWTVEQVQAFIDKYTAEGVDSKITGEMLLSLANKHEFPIELALIQGAQESNFGTTGAGEWTDNIYNWGNTTEGDNKSKEDALQDGDRVKMESVNVGVEKYMIGVKKNYLEPVNGDWKQLLENGFVNKDGNRYAKDKKYEEKLKTILVKVDKVVAPTSKEKTQVKNKIPAQISRDPSPYQLYKKEEEKKGQTPESEDWYNQNIGAKAEEDRKGYTTLNSYSGRKRYQETGIKRTGYNFVPDVNPINPKNKLKGFNDVRDTMISKWKKENPGKSIPSSWKNFAEKDFDKAKAEGNFSGAWSEDLSSAIVNAVIKPFYQSTKEGQQDDFHNIKDEKLRNEIIKAYDYVSHTEDNGTLVGRAVDRTFQRLDNAFSDILDGSPYQGIKRAVSILPGGGMLTEKKIGKEYYNDPGNSVGTSIYNLIASGSLEDQEKIIKGAIKKHKLSPKAQEYLYELWSNPEIFKNQQTEATEDLNVALAVSELPRLLYAAGSWAAKGGVPKAITKSKVYIDAIKAGKISKDGKVTASGLRYLKSSKSYKRQLRAAELAPKGSSPVKAFRQTLTDLFKNTDGTVGNKALNKELAGLTERIGDNSNILQDAGEGFKDSFNFFKNSWKVISKLPDNIVKNMSGVGYKEANSMRKRLEDLTGMTAKELKSQSPETLKVLLDKKTVEAFDGVKKAQKSYDDAWNAYKPLKTKYEKALKRFEGLPDSSDELASARKELDDVKELMQGTKENIISLRKEKNLRWERIGKIEDFVASDNTNWRNAVKGEEATANHLAGLEVIDEDLVRLLDDQKLWKASEKGAKQDYKKAYKSVENKIKSSMDTKDAKAARDLALKEGRASNLELGKSKGKAVTASEIAEEAPELMKAISKHEDVLKLFNSAGRFTAEVYNALRKKGPIGPEIEKEAQTYLPDPDSVDPENPEKDPTKPEVVPPEAPEIPGSTVEDTGKTELEQKMNPSDNKPSTLDTINSGLGTLSSYAGAAYNIARGMEDPEKANRNYVNPTLEKYEDNSQTQRNVIEDAFNASIGNSRNLSGGLASNFRSNVEKSWAEKIERNSQVNAQEAQNSMGVASRNVQRANQSEQYNAQVDGQADQMDMQSRAATKGFLGQGLADVANIGAVRRSDKNKAVAERFALDKMYGNKNPAAPVKKPLTFGSINTSPLEIPEMNFGLNKEEDNIFKN